MNTFNTVEDQSGPPVDADADADHDADTETQERTGQPADKRPDGAPPPEQPTRPARELLNNSPSDIEVITEAWI